MSAYEGIAQTMPLFRLSSPSPLVKLAPLLLYEILVAYCDLNEVSDSCKIDNQDRAAVYVSDVPTGDWPVGVDRPKQNPTPQHQEATECVEAISISSDSSAEDRESIGQRLARKAIGKRPMTEGSSLKKK